MHWCPYCGQACYCDCDDTDFGEFIPDGNCPHCFCGEEQGNEDDDYEESEQE